MVGTNGSDGMQIMCKFIWEYIQSHGVRISSLLHLHGKFIAWAYFCGIRVFNMKSLGSSGVRFSTNNIRLVQRTVTFGTLYKADAKKFESVLVTKNVHYISWICSNQPSFSCLQAAMQNSEPPRGDTRHLVSCRHCENFAGSATTTFLTVFSLISSVEPWTKSQLIFTLAIGYQNLFARNYCESQPGKIDFFWIKRTGMVR